MRSMKRERQKDTLAGNARTLPVHLHTSVFCRSLTKFIRRSFSRFRVQSRPARKATSTGTRDVHCNFHDRFSFEPHTDNRRRPRNEEKSRKEWFVDCEEILGSTNGEVSLEQSPRNGLTNRNLFRWKFIFRNGANERKNVQFNVQWHA